MNENKDRAVEGKVKAKAKTNVGFVEYLRAMVGNPYWFGTFGQKASDSLYRTKRKQYPKYYTDSDFTSQFGKKVVDCIGLLKSYIWTTSVEDTHPVYQSNGMPDVSANVFLSRCTRKGAIDTLPEVPGIAVFKPGHIGYYIGNGKVIEARGHRYGVVETSLKSRGWKNWAYIDCIEYL